TRAASSPWRSNSKSPASAGRPCSGPRGSCSTATFSPVREEPVLPDPAPRHEIAHLGHVELFTPEPEHSLDFFVRVLGLTENGTDGDSVYLRTWDDYEHHSLKLTAAKASGASTTSTTWRRRRKPTAGSYATSSAAG